MCVCARRLQVGSVLTSGFRTPPAVATAARATSARPAQSTTPQRHVGAQPCTARRRLGLPWGLPLAGTQHPTVQRRLPPAPARLPAPLGNTASLARDCGAAGDTTPGCTGSEPVPSAPQVGRVCEGCTANVMATNSSSRTPAVRFGVLLRAVCHAGYACTNGTGVLFGDVHGCGVATQYCPAGSAAPTPTMDGFYAAATPSGLFFAAFRCEPGWFCARGGCERLPLWALW